jgi:hypothetical protein
VFAKRISTDREPVRNADACALEMAHELAEIRILAADERDAR